jgi:hypothetical protein
LRRFVEQRKNKTERQMKILLLLLLLATIVAVSYLAVPAQPAGPQAAD